jgi:hypothetical protein
MATFLYRCPADGIVELRRPVGTAPSQVSCPTCAGDAHRVYTPPLVTGGSRSAMALIDRTERTRDEPEVVTSLPARGRAQRQTGLNPAWQRLPRP